ncbi:MAG: hypothetical protein ACFFD6_01320, partial [Candidatus Thorarchaeota archaeon]
SWDSIRRRIVNSTQVMVRNLAENGESLGTLDIFVLALGKCLEHYSRYYPNVTDDGRTIGVQEALESIRHILDLEIP